MAPDQSEDWIHVVMNYGLQYVFPAISDYNAILTRILKSMIPVFSFTAYLLYCCSDGSYLDYDHALPIFCTT